MNEETERLLKMVGGFFVLLACVVALLVVIENQDPENLNDPFEIVKLRDGNFILQEKPGPNQYFEYENTRYVFFVTDVMYRIEKTGKYPFSTELNKYKGIKVIPIMPTIGEEQEALNAVMNREV